MTPGGFDPKIAVLDLDTGQTTTLSSGTLDAFAEWRGDGGRVVFTSFVDGDDEIYSMAPDGTNRMRLTNRAGVDSAPTYRSDGSIMFVSDRSGALEIYTMAQDGTGLTQLTTGAALTSVPRATDQVPLRVQASYKYDALGRLREITTSQGALAQTVRYGYSGPVDSHSYTTSSSGEIESSSGGSPQYGFVGAYGRISNPATGLIHMGARMYQPNLGRFLSRDPITGGSANDYGYTSGDPVNFLDPSGRADCMVALFVVVCSGDEGEGAAVGGPGGVITGKSQGPGRPPKITSYPNRGDGSPPPPTSGRGGVDWPGIGREIGAHLKRGIWGALVGAPGWIWGDRVDQGHAVRSCIGIEKMPIRGVMSAGKLAYKHGVTTIRVFKIGGPPFWAMTCAAGLYSSAYGSMLG